MKFSIAPCMQKVVDGKRVMDLEGYIAEAQLAEKRGWFAAYTGEKHFGDTSYSSNPTMACLYGLSQTTTLKFCTGVTVLPLHHPVSVAEDAALVDTMYPNRFRMTTGAGYFAGDYAPFGVSLDERHERMEKGMDVIAAYRRSDCIDVPAPWSGRVPPRDEALGEDTLEVYMGAWSLPGVRRTAQTTDGWLTDPIRSGRWIKRLADEYRQECDRLGKKPRIALFREAWIDVSDEAARERYGPHVLGYSRVYFERGNAYNERYDPWLKDIESAADLTLDHVLPDRVLCGSAQSWVDQIGEWVESLEPEELVVRLRHFQGPSLEATLEAIERISADVMPHFVA